MSTDFRIEIAGTTYTPDNANEIADDTNPDTGTTDTKASAVLNVAGDVHGLCIQAGDIRGPIRLG
jgi:hypothetical protein